MGYEPELESALQAAHISAEALMREYAELEAMADAPVDISTKADKLSQELIFRYLHERYPDDAFCAEEESALTDTAPSRGQRVWVVDPIDGTRGFVKKTGEFSIMVGFMEDGDIKVGVVSQPAVGRITYAIKGGGCWKLDGEGSAPEPCRVSAVDSLTESNLTQSHTKDPAKPSKPVVFLKPKAITESYSAGIKLALVARGEADMYFNTYAGFCDWDVCAGHILVEEAGGRVTGLGGETLDYGQPKFVQQIGLLASNGLVHDAALTVWKREVIDKRSGLE